MCFGWQRTAAEAVLKRLQEHSDAWTRVDAILERSKSQQTKFYALQVLTLNILPLCYILKLCLFGSWHPPTHALTHSPTHPLAQAITEVVVTCNVLPLASQILEAVIKYRWGALPVEQREGIRNYVSNLIIKLSTDETVFRAEKVFINKLNLILVEVRLAAEQLLSHNPAASVSSLVSSLEFSPLYSSPGKP